MTSLADSSRRDLLRAASGVAGLALLRRTAGAKAAGHGGMLRGINLAGAEFGTTMPGRFGTDYTYPDEPSFARFKALGFNCIRLPFRWERLQPDLLAGFDEAEWARLSGAIRAAKRNEQAIVLDLHNFARRRVRADGFAQDHMIGSALVPAAALSACWAELARRTLDSPHVVHGIMNEPADIAPEAWLPLAGLAIAAIRGAGSRHLILAPGVDYSGAHSWYGAGNTLMARLRDPVRNLAIEVHQYLDTDSSGRSGQAVSATIGSERIEAFQEWARVRGFKAFLGEFGGGRDEVSLAALQDLLVEVERNPDVWIGWAAWAAGPWWPSSEPLRLEPDANGLAPPQLRVISTVARSLPASPQPLPGSTVDLELARGFYHGVAAPAAVMGTARSSATWGLRRDGTLQPCAADALCITDLGLAIEGAARNALVVVPRSTGASARGEPDEIGGGGPHPELRAWLLTAAQPTVVWPSRPIASTETASAAAGAPATFSLYVKSDPLGGGRLALLFAQARAELDLSRFHWSGLTKGATAGVSASGEWRRIHVTVHAAPAAAARTAMVSLLGPPQAGVLVSGAMVDAASAVRSYVADARPADVVTLHGPLAALLQSAEFSLLVETRGLSAAPFDLPLLTTERGLLLRRRADGAIDCPLLSTPPTSAMPLENWTGRRRCVLAVSRRDGRMTLATAGRSSVTSGVPWPAMTPPIRLGGSWSGPAAIDGHVARLAAFSRSLSAAEIEALIG